MQISEEPNLLNVSSVRRIKLVNKKYRAIKTARNQLIALSGVAFGFAAAEAVAHKGLLTMFLGGTSLVCMKSTEFTIKALKAIKPQYKEILARAKNINKLRQNLNVSV